MATIYEVSKLAGVSLATVSRVINGSSRVSDKTRVKVEHAMKTLEYRPNSLAQSLASSRSNSVGVMVPELHGPFFGTMLSGIEKELRNAGKHAIISVGHSDEAKERESIEFLASRAVDAQILHIDAVSDEYLEQLNRNGTQFVLINSHVPALSDRCISLDNEHGGYIATRAMLDRGHTSIACISGPQWKNDASERLRGHRKALGEAGINIDPALIVEGDFMESSGKAGIKHLLNQSRTFTALVCGNDEMAAAAMEVAAEHGISVPENLSIIGFDNVNFSRYLNPKLTTIDYPIYGMGQMAARWVLHHVYGHTDIALENVFEPKLLERASIAPPQQVNIRSQS